MQHNWCTTDNWTATAEGVCHVNIPVYTCILPDVKPQDSLLYDNIPEDRNGNSNNQIYQQATCKHSKFARPKLST